MASLSDNHPTRATGKREEKRLRKRNLFLRLVRKYPGISRQACARMMEVSTFSISRLTRSLIDAGVVVEDTDLEPVNPLPQGRPSTPLRLNPEYGYFAGIDVEAAQWRMVVIDFAGNPVFDRRKPLRPCDDREAYRQQLAHLLRECMTECGVLWEKVESLGVGVPGLLDLERGIVENYEPLPNFDSIPVMDICHEVTDLPVTLLNNVASLAVYDVWKRPAAEEQIALHVVVRSGIGSALLRYGQRFAGSHSHGGELGHFPLSRDSGGETVTLEMVAGLSALREQVPAETPHALWEGASAAVEHALEHPGVHALLSEAMTALGRTLAGVAALLDPDQIIVHSPLFSEENELWRLLVHEYEADLSPLVAHHVTFRRSEVPSHAPAVGAALQGLELLYPANRQV